MSAIFRAYVKMLQRYTLPTQMATGGVISVAGSAIAQHGIEGRSLHEHEWFRTRRLAVYGGIIFAPCANRWHALLNMIQLRTKAASECAISYRNGGSPETRLGHGSRLANDESI